MDTWRGKQLYAYDGSDSALDADIRKRAGMIYLRAATCKKGAHDSAVMGARGVDGLRVLDAWSMPRLVGGNTNAPTIMIADELHRARLVGRNGPT